MLIEIINWEKYNARPDVKSPTWFRLENSFCTSPDIFELTNDQKMVWLYLLCEASKRQSGCIPFNRDFIALLFRMTPEAVSEAVQLLENKQMAALRTRNVDVTSASRPRAARVRKRNATDRQTDRQTNKQVWDGSDELARVFENLKAVPAYWAIFDREHERKTVRAHMDRHGLTVAEMEQVTWELRCWADGPDRAIRSPRGLLSTFVQGYLKKRPPPKKAPEPLKVTTYADIQAELTNDGPLATSLRPAQKEAQ